MTWLFLLFIKCAISNYLLFHFQLVAKNYLEINALSCEYGAGWEVWVPLMRNGGCLCHPTPAEQQRLDRQHQHDDDHPDPTTIFYTQDQLLQLRASDRREPTRAEKLALAFRGARLQRNRVLRQLVLKRQTRRQSQKRWRRKRRLPWHHRIENQKNLQNQENDKKKTIKNQ